MGCVHVGSGSQTQRLVKCKYDCGNETEVMYSNLKYGLTRSCGCLKKNGGRPTKGNTIEYKIIDNLEVECVTSSNTDDVILVDKDKWEILKQHTWHVNSYGYAATNINGKIKLMHHILTPEVKQGYERDYINRNRLDNRLSNLRVITKTENLRNRSFDKSIGVGNIC